MRLRLVIVALAICLLSLSACANPFSGILGGSGAVTAVSSSTSGLSGSAWVLKQLHTDGKNQALVPTAPITLQLQRGDSTYIGSSGCNYYNGDYVVSGEHLTFKFKGVTQVACVGQIMSQEVAYLNTMQQVRTYEMSDDTLTLKNSRDEVVLIFTAA